MPTRPRATAYTARKTQQRNSAGPRSFWKKKNAERRRDADENRQHIFASRQVEPRRQPQRRESSRLRTSRSNSHRRAKYPARNSASSRRIASIGCTGPRLTFAELLPGPVPNRISSTESDERAR